MVAITISLIVLVAVSAMFVNTRRAYDTQDRLARVQENGRFAMNFLMQDIRQAGHLGCQTGQITTPPNPQKFQNMLDPGNGGTGFAFTIQIPIEGYDGNTGMTTWAPSGNNQFPSGVVAGTDMLAIRSVDPTSIRYLTTPISNARNEPLPVNDASVFNINDIIVVTDCNALDLMQVTDVQTSPPGIAHDTGGTGVPGNITQRLSRSYGSPDDAASNIRAVKVFRFNTRRYFIRNNSNNIPSLYMDINGGAAASGGSTIELVEGIEDLQVLYGIDTDGKTPGTPADDTPNIYQRANEVAATDWNRVVSIRIGILARTQASDNADADAKTYDVNGRTVTTAAGDRIQRRVFLTTIKLREMSLTP